MILSTGQRTSRWSPELGKGPGLGRIGSNYVWTPVYVSGSMRCVPMDGVKVPKTTWVLGQKLNQLPLDTLRLATRGGPRLVCTLVRISGRASLDPFIRHSRSDVFQIR